VEETFIS